MKEIFLAAGCFWGAEKYFSLVNGVIKTDVGYSNGFTPNPTYEAVCTGQTGHAETVHITYNENILPLSSVLSLFFDIIDPTSLNKQGGDSGPQYRTAIYYTDDRDLSVINHSIHSLQLQYSKPIVIEIAPLHHYYLAEDYHQKYLDKNPTGYCHIPAQKFNDAAQANPFTYEKPPLAELEKVLSPLQYEVTQNAATEPPFKNEYWNEYRKGIYVDITTGEPLFISSDKFDSGCGWPSFSRPISKELLAEISDTSHGMVRTEIRSKRSNSHLGHVFSDGPTEAGGLRYCINSAALRFIPLDEMAASGYENFIDLIE